MHLRCGVDDLIDLGATVSVEGSSSTDVGGADMLSPFRLAGTAHGVASPSIGGAAAGSTALLMTRRSDLTRLAVRVGDVVQRVLGAPATGATLACGQA